MACAFHHNYRLVIQMALSIWVGGVVLAAAEVRPGYGYPGKLTPYATSPQLQERMARFNLTAGWFNRAALPSEGYCFDPERCPVNELPYLLFSPKRGRESVPMVLYFGGTGEHGTDLLDQFRQTTVFEKVTSPDFQERHPCYVFAPMLPKGGVIRSAHAGESSNLADLVNDALFAVIASLDSPSVDTNRLYLTGLSWGGVVAWELPCGFPGRFAASVPVSSIQSPGRIPKVRPGNYWMIYNETSYQSERSQGAIREIAQKVRAGGGDFRQSTFPDKGHDAWSKAWREDQVWDWMFSKTADGSPVDKPLPAIGPRPAVPRRGMRAFLDGAVCTASQPGRDAGTGPERAADSLEATCYVSAGPMKRGDWWQIEFAEPVSGWITVQSGTRDGKGRVRGAHVETSKDGRFWNRAGNFSSKTGDCRFQQRTPIGFLRVLPEAGRPEPLVLREVAVEQDGERDGG